VIIQGQTPPKPINQTYSGPSTWMMQPFGARQGGGLAGAMGQSQPQQQPTMAQPAQPAMAQPAYTPPQQSPWTSSGVGTFNPVTTPQPVYDPGMTQMAKNQAVAQAQLYADPKYAQKQFISPGRSLDAGTFSDAIPAMGEALSQARAAQATIPLSDYIANQSNLLAGQSAQDSESLGLANYLGRLNSDQLNNQLGWYNTLMSPLLGALLGQ
jgi:hypothetical protein